MYFRDTRDSCSMKEEEVVFFFVFLIMQFCWNVKNKVNASGPSNPVRGATDSYSVMRAASAYRLFHYCVLGVWSCVCSLTMLSKSYYNYAVLMSEKRNHFFVTKATSEIQFHRFIYTRHFAVAVTCAIWCRLKRSTQIWKCQVYFGHFDLSHVTVFQLLSRHFHFFSWSA